MQETVPGVDSSKDKTCNGSLMDIDKIDCDDKDDYIVNKYSLEELGEDFLKSFCKKASISFFEQYGLVSHQINSYNDFIKYRLQNLFDSIGEINVQPGYDPSKKGDGDWKHASVKFGKVKLERPKFWAGNKFTTDDGKESLNLLPHHARLQNMTYSARMIVEIHIQVSRCLSFTETI